MCGADEGVAFYHHRCACGNHRCCYGRVTGVYRRSSLVPQSARWCGIACSKQRRLKRIHGDDCETGGIEGSGSGPEVSGDERNVWFSHVDGFSFDLMQITVSAFLHPLPSKRTDFAPALR
jgi:hypothetical protein